MTSDESLDRLARAVRSVQDSLASTTVTDEAAEAAWTALETASTVLAPFRQGFTTMTDWSVLGMSRGVHTLSPGLQDAHWEEMRMTASITFTDFFHGVNGAAHGGTIPLVFDEIFGRMSTSDGVLRRAASLTVDFRSVTPINTELMIDAHLERTEGRKSWLVGTLRHGDTITAEASSLWISLRPGAL
ncbi:MAG: PaaI family thioesterase [Actinomycetota bacterium]|nr:PaaI family thioesterase [Actinomycetota bacterium]